MKVSEQAPPKKFHPVIVTLESQEEVDQLFALLNNIPISEIVYLLKSELLESYASMGYHITHDRIVNLVGEL